jgi:hypothetical protein
MNARSPVTMVLVYRGTIAVWICLVLSPAASLADGPSKESRARRALRAMADLTRASVTVATRRIEQNCPTLVRRAKAAYEEVRKPVESAMADVIKEAAKESPDSPLFTSAEHEGPLGVPDEELVAPGPAQRAVVLVVDGQDLLAPLPGHQRELSYVRRLLSGSPRWADCQLRGFRWSGKLADSRLVLPQLTRDLELAAMAASARGARLIVIGHSWGTVLCLAAIVSSKRLLPGEIWLMITLGSPLEAQGEARRARAEIELGDVRYPLARPVAVAEWKNLWAISDKTSGPISCADNVCLPEYAGLDHSARNYVAQLEQVLKLTR